MFFEILWWENFKIVYMINLLMNKYCYEYGFWLFYFIICFKIVENLNWIFYVNLFEEEL